MVTQLAFAFPSPKRRGGVRLGAGRKPLPAHLRRTPHRARAVHQRANPVHVTLRAGVRSLRSQQVIRTVLGAVRDSNCAHFRIVHYSVQHNHVHLIAEAESTAALSSGVRGLMVRVARRVNAQLFRRGRFWADRWHGRSLTSPRQVRNALVYVLHNHRKHGAAGAPRGSVVSLDPCSSAQWFGGFAQPAPAAFRSIGPPCVVAAHTWLLRVGWQKGGKIRSDESPRA